MTTALHAAFKRFAVHDGPGVRTTLFLKGCPLQCLWCHNPEMISPKPELAFREQKCVLCGECVKICPNHEIADGKHLFHRENCTSCGRCAESCYFGALELVGKTISSTEAAGKLLEDREFYGTEGGITISGGEPMLQADFVREVFQIVRAENITTALDTCGNVSWSEFEKVLPFTNYILYDLKSADSEKHRTFTGHGNELILENLRKIDTAGGNLEIRMILVPGLNMEDRDIQGAAAILSPLKNVRAVRLLPYHALAHSKYAAIGRPDTMPNAPEPSKQEMEHVADILRKQGLNVLY